MLNLNYNLNGALKAGAFGPGTNEYDAELLAIAGGGRGGVDVSGGGGAGGYHYATRTLQSNAVYTIVVGAGQNSWFASGGVCTAVPPAQSISGSNSFIISNIDGSNFYTMGGGAASCGGTLANPVFPGSNGGSGGGGRAPGGSGGNGYTGTDSYKQGNNGGTGAPGPSGNGAGGGGASEAGFDGALTGVGGSGSLDLLPPDLRVPRAGGGSGARASGGSIGGWGGGGNSGNVSLAITASNGAQNTGGGGGGVYGSNPSFDSGKGGSGIVQIRYAGNLRATGGEITQEKNVFGDVLYTTHTFTASGLFYSSPV